MEAVPCQAPYVLPVDSEAVPADPALPVAVPVPEEAVKCEPVLPALCVKMECPVRTDEKVSDELSQPEPVRVEIVRNGSVAKEPLVVAVSSTSAPALPYTRRSPRQGESESQPVGHLRSIHLP